MTFKEYIDGTGVNLRDLSKKIGIHYSQLSRYASGVILPSLANAHRIYIFTNKKVALEDWFYDKK